METVCGEGIEDVDDGADARECTYLVAFEFIGVACAVQLFVVMANDIEGDFGSDTHFRENIFAVEWVLLHFLVFPHGEASGIVEDFVVDSHEADVAEHGSLSEFDEAFGGVSHALGEGESHDADVYAV